MAQDPRPTLRLAAHARTGSPASLALARAAAPTRTQLQAGRPYPLGAHWDGRGINFALVAPHASSVVLCLFDETGEVEQQRLPLHALSDDVWHGYLKDAQPGLIYGYRVDGDPAAAPGSRFNPAKLLLDPYAREVVGSYLGQDAFQGSHPADTGAIALKARVVNETYDWEDDQAPDIAVADMVLYELHVKGFTQLHPGVPASLRGSYAGLAHPAALDHLQQLGVTSVNLLPVHFRADEARLQHLGLSNYWGYASIGFFAPERRYWSGQRGSTPISEFRDMVKALHQRGLEVILDVVYNHTAETDEHGPTLSFRGIDNALYYHLDPDDPSRYRNWSGCGNCLNLNQPRVLQLVMDSLRYWVQEMHVDGFRFDLAPILGRDQNGFSSQAAFFAALRQDPVLAPVKLIAEPWDLGPGGYQLGNFPAGWMEWNDRYRDTMRALWLHQWPSLGEFAQRFAASSLEFRKPHRQPAASVNFLTAHDGFTLHDLVSYNHRHNEANGEDNRDGHHHNHSWNCGVEGPTEDAEIKHLRARLKRALLSTLFLSQGTPMLLAGDELGNSQQGNNNAYCQDNPLGWIAWETADLALSEFVARLIALRRDHPILRHNQWHERQPDRPQAAAAVKGPTLHWLDTDGQPMRDARWDCKQCYRLGILLDAGSDASGPPEAPDSSACLILINAEAVAAPFALPAGVWQVVLDSAEPEAMHAEQVDEMLLPAHAVLLLTRPRHA